MAVDFDQFPIYDVITQSGDRMSGIWITSMSTFFQTIITYLTQYGVIMPPVTTDQRDSIGTPLEGQTITNSDRKKLQVYLNGGWQEISTIPAP